jgi:hypothetical protein
MGLIAMLEFERALARLKGMYVAATERDYWVY